MRCAPTSYSNEALRARSHSPPSGQWEEWGGAVTSHAKGMAETTEIAWSVRPGLGGGSVPAHFFGFSSILRLRCRRSVSATDAPAKLEPAACRRARAAHRLAPLIQASVHMACVRSSFVGNGCRTRAFVNTRMRVPKGGSGTHPSWTFPPAG